MSMFAVNYWAVIVAAIAGWLLGAAWYMALAKPWMTAHGWTTEADMLGPSGKTSPIPFITSFVAELIMAWVLFGILWHVSEAKFTIMNGIVSAVLVWLGFVLTTISVNYAFSKKPPALIVIDAGHWLAVLVLMGIILGAWGM
jgi:hypothetical protein